MRSLSAIWSIFPASLPMKPAAREGFGVGTTARCDDEAILESLSGRGARVRAAALLTCTGPDDRRTRRRSPPSAAALSPAYRCTVRSRLMDASKPRTSPLRLASMLTKKPPRSSGLRLALT